MKEKATLSLVSKQKKSFKMWYKDLPFLIMVLPGLIFFLLFNYLPMGGLIIAFKQIDYSKGIFGSKWIGLENFNFFLKTPDALNVTKNTILYNSAFIILGLVVSLFFAITLNELRNKRMAKFYQSAMFLPYFLSWVIVSYLVFSFLSADYGIINNVLVKYFGKEAIDWYSNLNAWPFIIVFLNIWKYAGYSTVIYLAAIVGIDESYYEAAAIDGATKWQQITKITLPSLTPVITILTLLSVGRIFNSDFGLFYQATMQLGGGVLKPVADVLDTYVYQSLVKLGDIGMSSAACFYQAIVGFVLVLIANFIIKKIDSDNSLF